MEQRNGIRCASDLHAVVSCPRFGLFRGAVENISSTGLYVRTRNVSMCVNVPVTITLQADANDISGYCEATGVVVHQDADGFGVHFSGMDERCQQLLQQAMDAALGFSPASERLAV